MLKKYFIHLLISAIVASALVGIYHKFPNSYQSVDNRLRDFLFIARGEREHTNQLAIVTIDDKSLAELGQWPWERVKIAQIIQNLDSAGALIIGLDVVFAEIDKTSPDLIANLYGLESDNLPNYDTILAQVIAATPVVLGYFFDLDKVKNTDRFPPLEADISENNFQQNEFLPQAKGIDANLPILQQQALSAGFLNNMPDDDGIIRSVPLLIKYQEQMYTSMSFELFRLLEESPSIKVNYFKTGKSNLIETESAEGISHLNLGEKHIPSNDWGRLYLNYLGKKQSFPYISAVDVFKNNFDPDQVEGKVILVGATAVGISDIRATPFDSTTPGIEVHATALENMLDKNYVFKPDWAFGADTSFIIITALLLSSLYFFLPAWLIFLTMLVSLYLMFNLLSHILFQYGFILNIIFPFLTIIMVTISSTLANYFLETRQKNLIKANFARKVSDAVVEDILKHGGSDILIGQEKEITMFFSDVRSFTNISEKLGSPKKLIDLLNIYMTPMVEEIMKQSGTVDKFIGDAIMAYWNAPHSVDNHADKAVTSALNQMQQLALVNQELDKKYHIPIDIGIGINTGVATVGEMGSSGRSDYTIIGDSVNLASRLEGLNKMYGSHIIISEFTKAKLTGDYLIRELDLVQVKGKLKPVTIYEVIGFAVESNLSDKEMDDYKNALLLYREGNFQDALKRFQDLQQQNPETLYDLYIKRSQAYISNPPEDFNGVFIQTTK